LGVSDRPYFDWLVGALARFERERGAFRALAQRRSGDGGLLSVWGLSEQRENPALAWVRDALGRDRAALTVFDKFPTGPGVRRFDLNHLDDLPDAACDVLTLLRAACFMTDPARALAELRRILRPGGLAVVDWLHGCSDAPVLGFPLDPRYGDAPSPLVTTYMDPAFLAQHPGEFEGLIRHVNRPPWGVNLERPGEPVGLARRLKALAGRGPRRSLSAADYIETLRAELARDGKRLVEPAELAPHFDVAFRDARYLHRETGKFNLYLLTVLQPVGAESRASRRAARGTPQPVGG
jgi:SAM-dependent methyltransferase